MSPEQILGENVDARSDIFSLGVVLYQLVCGARPFERGDETDRRPSAHRIRRDPPIPLHRRAPDVPARPRAHRHARDREAPGGPLPVRRGARRAARGARDGALGPARREARRRARSSTRASSPPPKAPAAGAAPRASSAPRCAARSPGSPSSAASPSAAGIALQATAHREGRRRRVRDPLELVPAAPGFLRVLATPWAEVWVDGQRIDVTPFARGIPLAAGDALRHARAPERAGREAHREHRRRRDAHASTSSWPCPTSRRKDDAGVAEPERREGEELRCARLLVWPSPWLSLSRSRPRRAPSTHIVKPGETLAQIAERVYGDARARDGARRRQRARRAGRDRHHRRACASRSPRRATTR